MTPTHFRTRIRILHADASTGDPVAVQKYQRLIAKKRKQGLAPVRRAKARYSDAEIMQAVKQEGSTFKAALKLGYSTDGLTTILWRMKKRMIPLAMLFLAALSCFAGPFDSLKTNMTAKALAAPAPTYSATFAWNPVATTSGIAYRLWWGTNSHSYSNSVSVGTATTAAIAGLSGSTRYYVSVTASNAFGQSPFSNEISFTLPLPQPYTNVVTIAIEARDVTNPAAPFLTVWSVNLTNPPGAGRFFRMKQP